jgi:hypothetical protein
MGSDGGKQLASGPIAMPMAPDDNTAESSEMDDDEVVNVRQTASANRSSLNETGDMVHISSDYLTALY